MGKLTSLYGKTTGKIGSIVFSTSGGMTIAREYNPHVANPSTMAQVNQRARMKLMSQLSASLSPVIAMTKEGLVSKRNKFVKRNFGSSYASRGAAQISYENVQLTEGQAALPQITGQFASTSGGNYAMTAFTDEPALNISRVVWCLFKKTDEGNLSLVETQIVSQREAENGASFFPVYWEALYGNSENGATENYVIYAYGMSDTSERATAQYGNLNVNSATDLARLIANRTINFTDYLFTQTRGASWNRGDKVISATASGKARVFVTALGQGGTVSGGGAFDIGTEVTVVATPASGWKFKNWVYNGTTIVASTSASYTFTLNEQTDLVAVFDAESHEGL